MQIPQGKHIEFFVQQVKAYEDEWLEYANCAMNILIQEKKLFVGRIWGIQEKTGQVVLRFNEGAAPRMKQPYFLGMVGSDAPGDPQKWKYSYYTFRNSVPPGPRYYNGAHTDIHTQVFWKTESGKSYILVSGFDAAVLARMKERYLDKQLHPMIIVAETDPPIEYLKRLKGFVEKNAGDPILNLDLALNEENWRPTNMDNTAPITDEVLRIIEGQKITLIQGPPGTGKSYLAAALCGYYLEQGNSVCLTALTNKALMEVGIKEGLQTALEKGQVYKTNLSSDERRKLPAIKSVEQITPKRGDLLLATYYKLAEKHAELIAGSQRFDFLVIEEASQAYLATLAMFSTLARRVLIVGDHKQLTPIVKKEVAAKEIFSLIEGVIYGMQTFAFNKNDLSYRLTKTRRLTTAAANLTGLYYERTLKSISKLEGKTTFKTIHAPLFHPEGGYSLAKLASSKIGFREQDLFRFICIVVLDIKRSNPDFEIAVLVPNVQSERDIYTQYSKMSHDYSQLTISTVHKIQGLTCDVTIVYLPLTTPFELGQNLFNVATSRATRGTLVISYQHIGLYSSATPETRQFIKSMYDVSEAFKQQFEGSLHSS